MDTFTQNDLRRLLEIDSWPCVTLFLPTGSDMKQGSIRLKNMAVRAERELIARGLRTPEAAQMLAPVKALIDDARFWKEQGEGLAIVATSEEMRAWRVPLALNEAMFLGRRPSVKPFLPLAANPQGFYLLAVSQKGARLFAGDPWQLTPLSLESMPAGLIESLDRESPRTALQSVHTSRGSTPIYAASGGEPDTHKDDLLAWFRMIDRAIHDHLRESRAPLVFAGVEYLFPIFSRANSYPHLFAEPACGNPDHDSLADLHQKASKLLAPSWTREKDADRQRFERHLGTRLVSASIEDVLVAAHEGRVEALFVDRNNEVWGRFDPQQEKVELLTAHSAGSEDLLDRAAFETLKHRGRVYGVPASEVPGGIAIAALYRYEAPVLVPANG